ncbi:MAG: pSer/pThr/pTyr-binding forkhead associated (FHA) protein [Myxococcota bacterium]|jgi:pSer/pThr/pTyr-binding forkhead associated (FHA) protein
MKTMHPPCWLSCEALGSLRVGAAGLLIGRSADCDLVLPDPRTSRHHALVREGLSGPLLIPLGRNPTLVNHARISQVMPLQSGDQLQFPGVILEVHLQARSRPSGRTWLAVRERGTVMAPIRRTMLVGGGEQDDMILPGWPDSALRLDIAGRSLIATLRLPATIDDIKHSEGAVVQLTSGNMISFGGERLRLLMQRDHAQSTMIVQEDLDTPVSELRFASLPVKGGRLQLRLDEREVTVELSDLRARLVEALARAGGDYIRDAELIPIIYPPPQRRTGRDLTLLLHRLRTVLVRVGIDPYRLIEREGDRTRLIIGENTVVHLGAGVA